LTVSFWQELAGGEDRLHVGGAIAISVSIAASLAGVNSLVQSWCCGWEFLGWKEVNGEAGAKDGKRKAWWLPKRKERLEQAISATSGCD
jgi:hypothetical protein